MSKKSQQLLAALLLFGLVQLAQAQDAVETADQFFQAKDWANAVAAYEAIVQSEPSNFQAWNRLGSALHSLEKYEQAAAAFEKAVALNNNATVSKYNLACAYARANKKEKALAVLEQIAPTGFFQPEQIRADQDLTNLLDGPRFQNLLAVAAKAVRPCTAAPEFRQFDFWIGEWDVLTPNNQPAGTSSIQLILGECVIMENWTGVLGVNGKSFNLYNAARNKWQQTWVDDRGGMTEYLGEWKGDRMEFLAEQPQTDGTKQLLRMTFFKFDADRVRQFGESSTDNGKTWNTRYDLTYIRKK